MAQQQRIAQVPDVLWFLIPIIPFALLFLLRGNTDLGRDPVEAHKARLRAVDQDEARELLTGDEAAEARTEIKRRLLKAARTSDGLSFKKGSGLAPAVLWGGLAILLVSAAGWYRLTGAPDLPPSPGETASRLDQRVSDQLPTTYREAMAQIRGHLTDNPDDAEGWGLLAETAVSVGDPSTAAIAYGELARLSDQPVDYLLQQVQAMMALTERRITPAVGLVLEQVRAEIPNHPSLDYYRGITALQVGRERDAERIWTRLLNGSPPTAWYVPQIRSELARLNGVSAGSTAPPNGAVAPRLSEEAMAVAADMTAEEQREMIEGMLSRLAARLAENPDDAAGWLRLAEARFRLGDIDGSRAVIKQAKEVLREDQHQIFATLIDKLNDRPDP